MKFKSFVIYSLKQSNIEYVLGLHGKHYYFMYYREKSNKKKTWTPYPSKRPEAMNYSFVQNENNKRVSRMKAISKEKLFTEVL